MKLKSINAGKIVTAILFLGILILSIELYQLNKAVEVMKSEGITMESNASVGNMEIVQTGLIKRLTNIEEDMPDEDLRQFIKITRLDYNRMQDLLYKALQLDKINGVVTDVEIGEQVIVTVKKTHKDDKETEEEKKITLSKDYTAFMVTELTLVPVSKEEFLEVLQSDLASNFQQPFTFVIANGEAIHVYQGNGED